MRKANRTCLIGHDSLRYCSAETKGGRTVPMELSRNTKYTTWNGIKHDRERVCSKRIVPSILR